MTSRHWLAATQLRHVLVCGMLAASSSPLRAESPARPASLKVAVVQLRLEPQLLQNRDKIAGFIRQAKQQGCRVVVFPETALYWPDETPKKEIDDAVAHLQQVVGAEGLYALVGGQYKRDALEAPFERLLVIDPNGKIIHEYRKLWYDDRFCDAPGLFEIDGVSCSATLCADRWVRSVEELPAFAGAKILFECSNNYNNEWIADLGWYWYVPRALRNEVFVVFANTSRERAGDGGPGHGHSALVAPDGRLLAHAGEESDKLILAEFDLSLATGNGALKRRNHPLFKPFWELGVSLLAGRSCESPPYRPLAGPEVGLKVAAAQIACSQRIDENVAKIVAAIRAAAAERADAVVFPELAVTGAREADVATATQADLEHALSTLQQSAKDAGIYVACGLPWQEHGQRYNGAVVIGPAGNVLTRYAQIVVDRPDLFAAGTSTQAMWFEIKGALGVVTIGRDALWSEIAEMAALRGAQLHLHLSYDQDTSPAGCLLRKQLSANLASFRTFTATVNAASPSGERYASAPAAGGSALWEDFHRARAGRAGGFAPHSAVRLAEAKLGEAMLYSTQMLPRTNRQFGIVTGTTNPQMAPWYAKGAQVIYETAPGATPVER